MAPEARGALRLSTDTQASGRGDRTTGRTTMKSGRVGPSMITGAHAIIYSTNARADREFFRDVLRFANVDAGEGWLIFALPPAELAVHPAEENGSHQLFLTCDDLEKTMRALRKKEIKCSAPTEHDWGTMTMITLPGGSKLGLYQPTHAMAHR